MQNNNPAENWKQKLEELDYIPGADFNKKASWEKLQNRMQPKQNTSGKKWHWLAAACLLLIAGTLFLVNTAPDTNISVSQNQDSIHKPGENITADKDADQKPAITITQTATDAGETKKQSPVKIKNEIKNNTWSEAAVIPEIIITEQEQPVAEIKKIILSSPDSTTTASVIMPAVQKKLRLVHINELGIAEDAAAIAAKNRELLFQQNKLYNRAFASVSELNMQDTKSSNGIIIKLNPQK